MAEKNPAVPDSVAEIARIARDAVKAEAFDVLDPVSGRQIPLLQRRLDGGGVEVSGLKRFVDEWRGEFADRRKGTAKLATLESFIAFAKRHLDANSALFAALDAGAPTLTAVFDYHATDGQARFCQHRAVYAYPLSPEFVAWKGRDGKPMTQLDWACWIEDHIAELAAPTEDERDYEQAFKTRIADPADLITLSRGLSVNVESKLVDFRVLQSGETQLSYDEVHRDGAGQKLIIPGLFIIRIPLFVGGDQRRLLARLRYRKRDGGVAWFFELYRADAELRDAMAADAALAAAETGMPLYEGAPEA